MSKMTHVQTIDERVDRPQQRHTFIGDLSPHDAAVRPLAPSGDQPARFEPIEQARDVRLAALEALANLAAGEPLWPRLLQRLEHVVLPRRQAERIQGFSQAAAERFSDPQDAVEHLVLGSGRH